MKSARAISRYILGPVPSLIGVLAEGEHVSGHRFEVPRLVSVLPVECIVPFLLQIVRNFPPKTRAT